VDGILLDLGLSSLQLDDPGRGFSFRTDGPLDMRFGPEVECTAAEIVNDWDREDLEDIIRRYGEERQARRIASAIETARPIQTTGQLARVIGQAVGRRYEAGRIPPATRTFQAIRIAVNGELDAVAAVLPMAAELLRPGGRLAVISFHSLEDRLVKNFLRGHSGWGDSDDISGDGGEVGEPMLRAVNRKPIMASEQEIERNPRARSARLRIGERPG
jgi:16S rRNA (cytosine1402-N4)-methyltransferase